MQSCYRYIYGNFRFEYKAQQTNIAFLLLASIHLKKSKQEYNINLKKKKSCHPFALNNFSSFYDCKT